jgi:hypothetical protein
MNNCKRKEVAIAACMREFEKNLVLTPILNTVAGFKIH